MIINNYDIEYIHNVFCLCIGSSKVVGGGRQVQITYSMDCEKSCTEVERRGGSSNIT